MNSQQIEQLKKIGKEWTSPDGSKHRIYFNDLPALIGLDISYYNSGNISGATWNGEKISNGMARRILGAINGKLFYDFADDKFHGQYISEDYFGDLVNAIKAQLAEAEPA